MIMFLYFEMYLPLTHLMTTYLPTYLPILWPVAIHFFLLVEKSNPLILTPTFQQNT